VHQQDIAQGPHVTVAICTHDRAGRLALTLASLTRLVVPDGLIWELLLVDNRSRDGTTETIARFADQLPLTRLYHAELGLSGARNLALKAARGDVIAFTDDDCLVDAHWLSRLHAEFHCDPSLDGLGGRVDLYNPEDARITIATGDKRTEFPPGGRISHEHLFTMLGCNMAFTRSAIRQIGRFDEHLGPGKKTGSAEDTDYLYRAFKAGLRLVYSPEVIVYHNHGRRPGLSMQRLMRNYAVGRGAFYCKHILARDADAFRLAFDDLARHVAGMRPLLRVIGMHIAWAYRLGLGALYRVVRWS
jgi:glycosyltransferase involved in cell wall biosynthesis